MRRLQARHRSSRRFNRIGACAGRQQRSTRCNFSRIRLTIAEGGVKDFDVNPWWGISGPAGLSPSIVSKINADVAEILKEPDFPELLAKQGRAACQLAGAISRIAREGYREMGKSGQGGRDQDEPALRHRRAGARAGRAERCWCGDFNNVRNACES